MFNLMIEFMLWSIVLTSRIEFGYKIYKICDFRDGFAKTAIFAKSTIFLDGLIAKTTKFPKLTIFRDEPTKSGPADFNVNDFSSVFCDFHNLFPFVIYITTHPQF